MDLEKENFNMTHLCDYPVYSLCQAPDNASCLYFGDGNGELKLFDERMGKVSATWDSHDNTINSIDFHPEKKYMLATSSTDRTARIWDLRRLKKKKEDCLKVLKHSRSVQSAYFSPGGRMLATTR
jgi:WD40 repeat protein